VRTPIVVEPHKFSWIDFELPDLRPHDILLRVRACSICGSDLHVYKGLHPYAPLPACTGHELAGDVVEVGSAVTRVKSGDRVALLRGGGTWSYRLAGRDVARFPSGFTEYIPGQEDRAFKIPEHVSYDEASCMEPLAVAVHAVKRSKLGLGDSTAVLGAGPIGLMTLQVARAAGSTRILVTETVDYRRRLAKELGADEIVDPVREEPVGKVMTLTGGVGVDAAFECVGVEATVQQSLGMLKKGGTSVVMGIFEKPSVTIDVARTMSKEGTMATIWGAEFPRDYEDALALIGSGRVNIAKMITHRFQEERADEAMRLLLEKGQNAVKVLIVH
jgi:2-desacetyl-2-hydroxyethyl bacteriochlorophyllide A dehydrogenase